MLVHSEGGENAVEPPFVSTTMIRKSPTVTLLGALSSIDEALAVVAELALRK